MNYYCEMCGWILKPGINIDQRIFKTAKNNLKFRYCVDCIKNNPHELDYLLSYIKVNNLEYALSAESKNENSHKDKIKSKSNHNIVKEHKKSKYIKKSSFKEFKCSICNEIYYSNKEKEMCSTCRLNGNSHTHISVEHVDQNERNRKTVNNKHDFRKSEWKYFKKYFCSKCITDPYSTIPLKSDLCKDCVVKTKNKRFLEICKLKKLINIILNIQIIPYGLINFCEIRYLNIYKDYTEILFLEYGMRFKPNEIFEPPSRLIRKINLERYLKLGRINHRVKIVCEKCHYEFIYIYKGGPHRKYCPVCTDWIKKFPEEPKENYSIIK